jgi:hypothetical protein
MKPYRTGAGKTGTAMGHDENELDVEGEREKNEKQSRGEEENATRQTAAEGKTARNLDDE